MSEEELECIEEKDRGIQKLRKKKAAIYEEYEKGDEEWQHYTN